MYHQLFKHGIVLHTCMLICHCNIKYKINCKHYRTEEKAKDVKTDEDVLKKQLTSKMNV